MQHTVMLVSSRTYNVIPLDYCVNGLFANLSTVAKKEQPLYICREPFKEGRIVTNVDIDS